MPFTFSHPALILPFAFLSNKWFSITGLVIGSITPDFEYFLRMEIKSNFSHSLMGLLWFDLPLGLLLAFIFHNIVRDSLIDNLPGFLKQRLISYKYYNWNTYFRKKWLVVMISILIGAASHIFWDNFTHEGAFFAEKITAVISSMNLFGHEIPFLRLLQHSSTILGGFLIAYTVYKLPKNNTQSSADPKYILTVVLLSSVILSVRLMNGLNFENYGNIIVTVISALLISIILTPLILKLSFVFKNN